ncbi:hypothetical protein EIP91_005088 [Steccherinum ochraceum]|uniref:Uncharacterized protein n=1 Tax=Steccherinum ochraceum TaxID=92696 RepID=A0A4V2MVT3_9APHY|nr:hypothetical protein EIP91_005088 [Steccherinum ochraceum]
MRIITVSTALFAFASTTTLAAPLFEDAARAHQRSVVARDDLQSFTVRDIQVGSMDPDARLKLRSTNPASSRSGIMLKRVNLPSIDVHSPPEGDKLPPLQPSQPPESGNKHPAVQTATSHGPNNRPLDPADPPGGLPKIQGVPLLPHGGGVPTSSNVQHKADGGPGLSAGTTRLWRPPA